jgi:hypothetical protein
VEELLENPPACGMNRVGDLPPRDDLPSGMDCGGARPADRRSRDIRRFRYDEACGRALRIVDHGALLSLAARLGITPTAERRHYDSIWSVNLADATGLEKRHWGMSPKEIDEANLRGQRLINN